MFEEEINTTRLAADGPHQILIRFGGKSQRAFGAITQLVEPGGEAAIDDNEQFVRQIRSGFAAQLCIQVLGSGVVIPFARSIEEAQNRASRSRPPESIWSSVV